MFDAYRGTIDERHGTVAEAVGHVGRYFDGEFGSPLLDCSYVALQDSRPISVTLVSMDDEEPLLAQAYTAPEWQNKGLARALIQISMNALAETGTRSLKLMATAGNRPAEQLYRRLGFKPVQQENP